MKAIRSISSQRFFFTIGLIAFAISLGYSQGFAENPLEANGNFELLLAQLDNDFNPETSTRDTKSISAAEFSFEAELETEKWMITPFDQNLEASTLESWMTQPFSFSLEPKVEFEKWMTISFTESAEKELAVEDWMTQILIPV